MPHHGRDLVVGQLELLEDAGVERDLAAGHAPRVDLRRSEDVHLPLPIRRVLPEHGGLRDDALRDRADALDLLRVAVDVALRALLLEHLLVGERRALVYLGRGDEEELAAFDADGALLRRRRARGQHHRGHCDRSDEAGHPFHREPLQCLALDHNLRGTRHVTIGRALLWHSRAVPHDRLTRDLVRRRADAAAHERQGGPMGPAY